MSEYIAQNREDGGRLVREEWIRWAKTQLNCKPSWLVEWKGLSEADKEADRCIWDGIVAPYASALAEMHRELQQLRDDKDFLLNKVFDLQNGES
jgi:hypothetical protein